MANPNVLSERYVTSEINEPLSPTGIITQEREWWVSVMKAEKELDVPIPLHVIKAYEKAIPDIDFGYIKQVELKTKHDVVAKKQDFTRAAGLKLKEELIHRPMTSRDLTENVEQIISRNLSKIIFGKFVSVLRHFVDRIQEYYKLEIAARSHHQAAQSTTLGRRVSMWAEELYLHLLPFEKFIEDIPLRGIKGPVGTQADVLNMLETDFKVRELDEMLAKEYAFKNILETPGQIYPRSLDSALANHLSQIAMPLGNYATTMRLMAGLGLVTEGFAKHQKGSSAMPHKMNARSSERICSFVKLVKMYQSGATLNAGQQWEEGDVECSAMRRVLLSDMFYVADGLCETVLTVLNGMGVYGGMCRSEVERYKPFLATTLLRAEAEKHGIAPENAYKAIQEVAIDEVKRMRKEGSFDNKMVELLAEHPTFDAAEFRLNEINALLGDSKRFIGSAINQMERVLHKTGPLFEKYKKEAQYEPRPIL